MAYKMILRGALHISPMVPELLGESIMNYNTPHASVNATPSRIFMATPRLVHECVFFVCASVYLCWFIHRHLRLLCIAFSMSDAN